MYRIPCESDVSLLFTVSFSFLGFHTVYRFFYISRISPCLLHLPHSQISSWSTVYLPFYEFHPSLQILSHAQISCISTFFSHSVISLRHIWFLSDSLDFTTAYRLFPIPGFHCWLWFLSHSQISPQSPVSLLSTDSFPFLEFHRCLSIFFQFFLIPEYFSTIMNYFPFLTAIYGYTATYGLVSFDTIYKYFLSFFRSVPLLLIFMCYMWSCVMCYICILCIIVKIEIRNFNICHEFWDCALSQIYILFTHKYIWQKVVRTCRTKFTCRFPNLAYFHNWSKYREFVTKHFQILMFKH